MEELMMLVMELRVGLPRLPPLRLEWDARVIQNTVVVVVNCYCVEWDWNEKMQIVIPMACFKATAVVILKICMYL